MKHLSFLAVILAAILATSTAENRQKVSGA
jgi:hypothetical protein